METIGLFFKTLWSPAESMFLLSKKPRVLAPLIIVAVLQLGVGLVSLSRLDFGQVALRQIERSPRSANMSEEQKQNAVRVSRQLAPVFIAFGTIAPALFITIAAGFYFGIFSMVGRTGEFKAFYAVTLFAYIPLLIRQFASVVQLLGIPGEQIDVNELGNLSLALFLDRSDVSKVVYALASIVDITSIWIVILLVIGYKFLTPKSVGLGLRSTAVAIPYFFVSLIFAGLRMLQTG
jgi:hypothetical protein